MARKTTAAKENKKQKKKTQAKKTTRKPVARKKKRPSSAKRAVSVRARATAATPTVPEIKEEVSGVLSDASPRPPDPITACMSLEFELRLTDAVKRRLSRNFQAIARRSEPGASISDDECGALSKVEDAWILVVKKSGLSLDKECK